MGFFSVFVMRYSKTLPDKYISSTAVVCAELCKLMFSVILHVYFRCRELGIKNYSFKMLMQELFGKESDSGGIALVQFPTGDKGTINNPSSNAMVDKALGVLSVFITCLCSGFAGVYFEKILKKSKVTLWARNVQLALFSVIPGYFIGCLLIDGDEIREHGFFGGYNRWTVLSVICQSLCGIITAIVVKYADNILKGFANSISIILSCVVSYFFFDFHITLVFDIGVCIVIFSSYLYGKKPKEEQKETNEEAEYIKLEEQKSNDDDEEGEYSNKVTDNDTIVNVNENEDIDEEIENILQGKDAIAKENLEEILIQDENQKEDKEKNIIEFEDIDIQDKN
ncbi:hypothetical protein LY90DRAFT_516915 [Neocallimastix californiae]|uniref:Nucleotide-sugar transporter n=1 Tax=Neocallimastix californiae TaxID=1754190 RepID=A0A1Y2ACI0_9FUNG|nr:hypothetical protein LY90DRAFT_516915 [Neocallimastix californiae]|eukprot:ORY20238.1 hypothetical protein LY90DRAFT_516915 [Neocallimastix californiae]